MNYMTRNGTLLSETEAAEMVIRGVDIYGRAENGDWFVVEVSHTLIERAGTDGNIEFNYQQRIK